MDPMSIVPYLGVIISVAMFVILAVVALIVFFAFRKTGLLGQIGRALDAGSSMPGQIEVERNGRMGEATVLDRNDLETVAKNRTMIYHMGALVLEVRLPGFAPYRAPCRQWFIGSKWSHVSQGEVVPVRVDVQNPQIVFVDLAATDQRREYAERAEREAHARRQAELLGLNRR
jgi:hypothetical protein